MSNNETNLLWWSSADIRLVHSELDPANVSKLLGATPLIAQSPGESQVRHGNCHSAGYWCIAHRENQPSLPDSTIRWAEQFVSERELAFRKMLREGYSINVYVGIHTDVMTLGFELPQTPTLWNLRIPIGIEIYS